jgi:hypothetical protein
MIQARKALATAALLVAAASANAALLTINGGVYDNALNGNDIAGVGAVSGYWGGNLWLNGPGTVAFTYAGSEARWDSNFTSGAGVFFNHGPTNINDSFSISAGTGYVPFTFNVTGNGSVSNGSNSSVTNGAPVFFLSTLQNGQIYIGLNDDGRDEDGNGSIDGDADDLGVFVTASEVPVPGTLGLLGLGLAGLGMLRRRTAA